jgi:hypothetical protein
VVLIQLSGRDAANGMAAAVGGYRSIWDGNAAAQSPRWTA